MQGNSGHFWLLLLFSQSVMSDSLQPHGLQHTRPLCPSPSPKVCPSWCPLHQWCHPPISSSDALLSFCLQSFPASGTFPMSQLFTSDDQNTGVSASASILQRSTFFSIQLSWPNVTTWKTIDLTTWTFVCRVMSLLFNTLLRFVIAFLPRSNIFWFHGCSHHSQWF